MEDAAAASTEKRTNVDGKMPVIKEAVEEETQDNLKFEDPFCDDMEEEEIVDSNSNTDMMETQEAEPTQVYQAGKSAPLGKDEVLDYDASAYDLYHSMTAEWPALSLDIVRDSLGSVRTRFPHTIHVVTGSQADKAANNSLTVMKMSQLHRTSSGNPNNSDDESDEEDHMDPVLESRSISHFGGVNRVRSMPQASHIVSTWADTGKVHLWDISSQLNSLAGKASSSNDTKPMYTFEGHADEGYAMDWNKS